MPERTEHAHGTPSWIDVQTSDTDAAQNFYGQLFGWSWDAQEIPDSGGAVYAMAQIRGKSVAAVSSMPDEMKQMGIPPHWNSYVTVDDVDKFVEQAEKAGGSVMAPPFDVMDAGRMAVVADPTGAVFIPWQAKENIGAELVNEQGALVWTELMSPDVAKAAEFYKDVFGWDTEVHDMGPDMTYTEFKLNGKSIAGGMKPPMPGIPPVWAIYIAVDDLDGTVAKAQELGGSVLVPTMDYPGGKFAALLDPQGAAFSVMKPNEPAP
jgi:predicted enzyme related to lactoylglutathione lyase